MGVVYYGKYAEYYEISRVEAVRALGFSYHDLEKRGYLLPVRNLKVRYILPARYDEILRVVTTIPKMPGKRLHYRYEMYNAKDQLINTAKTTLVFVDKSTFRPISPPGDLLKAMEPYFAPDPGAENSGVSAASLPSPPQSTPE